MAEAITRCATAGVSIIRLENLPLGATCVECSTEQGADELRFQVQDHVLPTAANDWRARLPMIRQFASTGGSAELINVRDLLR
jgi:hypothetical protein